MSNQDSKYYIDKMVDAVVKYAPQVYVDSLQAKTRDEYRKIVTESDAYMMVIECCAEAAKQLVIQENSKS